MMYTNIRTLYGQKRAQPYCPVCVPCGSMCMLCIDTDFHSNRLVLIRPTKQLMQDAWTRRTRETLIMKQYEQIATSSSFRINQAEKIKRFTGETIRSSDPGSISTLKPCRSSVGHTHTPRSNTTRSNKTDRAGGGAYRGRDRGTGRA